MNLQKKCLGVLGALAFCVTVVCAQGPQNQKVDSGSSAPISPFPPTSAGNSGGSGKMPVPAARGVSPAYDPLPYDPAQVEPDTNTLSGAELFGLGSLEHSRNIFDPSVYFSGLGQTGVSGNAGQSSVEPTAMFGGSLNFSRFWSRYRLSAIYSGGDSISGGSQVGGAFHDAVVTQEINWQRWRLRLRDDFVAAPGATFTGTGMGGPGLIGEFSSMLGASLQSAQGSGPNQTIQTGLANRYQNMALGEVEYSFSRRTAFTVSGSYGLLHFTDPGYVDSHNVNAQAGFDYLLDPRNSIAVLAGYGKIDYNGTSSTTTDYTAALAYGRRIAGRLAFQAAAGPDQIRSGGTAYGNFQHLTWSVRSALTYQTRRTGYSLSFWRGLVGGSGVLLGAVGDTTTGTVHHQFSRFWSGSVNGGYAFNKGIAPAGVSTFSFTNWFAGAGLDRQLGRHAHVGFSYGVQEQNSPGGCPVTSCGVSGLQQTFGMTVNWHLRPVE